MRVYLFSWLEEEEEGIVFFELWDFFALGWRNTGYFPFVLGALVRAPGWLILIKYGVWLESLS